MEGSRDNKKEKKDNINDNSTEEIERNLEANEDELSDGNAEVEFEEIKDKYESNLKELDESNNRFLRLQADFSNYRKRVEKEKESTYLHASQELIIKLLPIIDNFERALLTDAKPENFYQGVEMVYKQFVDILKDNGLEEIDALNQKFNPNYHHAVAQEESDEYDEDTVIEVFLKGYTLKGKIIRPSMVKVSK